MTIDEIRELAETPTNSLPEKVGKAGDMEIIKGFREESTLKVVGAGGKTVYFAYRHDTAITGGWGLWVSIRGKGDIPEGTIGLVGAEIEELSRFVQDILAAHPDRVYRAKKWTKEAQR